MIIQIFKKALFYIVLIAVPVNMAVAQGLTVTYLPPEYEGDERSNYYIDLLELSLEKTVETHGEYELVPAEGSYTQREGLIAMRDGKIDVVHTMTSDAREMVFRPIRVPLNRGLIGYRLLLVKEGQSNLLLGKADKEGAKSLTYIQGSDWPDTEILKKNGYEVTTHKSYLKLFELLQVEEGDAFPRSVMEIWDELEKHDNLSLEENIVLKYPASIYFFVRKSDKALAERIKIGLDKAIKDGSFDTIFQNYHKGFFDRANFNQRTVITLVNPLLPEDTPLENEEYWFDINSSTE